MNLNDLNEAVNPYFYEQTFYSLAKKAGPDLKRIITEFLRKKNVSFDISRFSSKNQDFLDSKTLSQNKDKKDKDYSFSRIREKIGAQKEFFTANKSYNARFDLPAFKIGDAYVSDIAIKSNESFFEDGYDLAFKISKDVAEDAEYSYKDFESKIDLMRKPEIVL